MISAVTLPSTITVFNLFHSSLSLYLISYFQSSSIISTLSNSILTEFAKSWLYGAIWYSEVSCLLSKESNNLSSENNMIPVCLSTEYDEDCMENKLSGEVIVFSKVSSKNWKTIVFSVFPTFSTRSLTWKL